MRATVGLAGLLIAAVMSSGCSGGDGDPATDNRNDLAAVGLERDVPPPVPDPDADAVATMCGGLVVVQGTPGGLFDADTGTRHDVDLRLPRADDALDAGEFRIVDSPACVWDGNRWVVAVEFVRRDLSLDAVVAGFDGGGNHLWSRSTDEPFWPAAVGATVVMGDRVLDAATGDVVRKARPADGYWLRAAGEFVIGVDRSRMLEVTDDIIDVGRFADVDGRRVPGSAAVFEPFPIDGGADLVFGRSAPSALDRTSAYDPTTGERRWTVPLGEPATFPVVDRSLDLLLWPRYSAAAGSPASLNAVDLDTGTIKWRRRLVGEEPTEVSVGAGVGLYTYGKSPHLFDARTGRSLRLDDELWPVAVSDAGLLVLDEDDEPRLVDPRKVTTPLG